MLALEKRTWNGVQDMTPSSCWTTMMSRAPLHGRFMGRVAPPIWSPMSPTAHERQVEEQRRRKRVWLIIYRSWGLCAFDSDLHNKYTAEELARPLLCLSFVEGSTTATDSGRHVSVMGEKHMLLLIRNALKKWSGWQRKSCGC